MNSSKPQLTNMSVSKTKKKTEPEIDYSVSELTLETQHSALKYLLKMDKFNNLKKLIISYCELPWIPKLPEGIEYLDISGNLFNYIPHLPTTLKYLNIGCNRFDEDEDEDEDRIEIIENLVLPPNLEELFIDGSNFNNIKLQLPKTLKKININGLYITDGDNFDLSKDYLPDGLLKLSLWQTSDIIVSSLPDSITHLSLEAAQFDRKCVLPKSLVSLDLWHCNEQTLPPIPDSVEDCFDFSYMYRDEGDDITIGYQYLLPITQKTTAYLDALIFHNWNITKHRHSKFLDEFMDARVRILMSPTRIARLLENGEIEMDNLESTKNIV